MDGERTWAMRVCLFEDREVANLEPLTLTRPAFELLCGQTSLGAKQCRYFAPCAVGALIRPHLADLYRAQQPATAVNHPAWLRAEPTILVNGRWLPPPGTATALFGPCLAMVGGEVAYAVVGPDRLQDCSENTLDDCLETWKSTLPQRPAGGRLVKHLWDLVQHNGEQLALDFQQSPARLGAGWRPATLAVVGPPERLLVDPTAQLDPLVVADTTRGPVVIDREAVVTAFSRLEGPCFVGPQTHVLGAKIRAGTTLGPQCRIGGEVEASIVHGYSNKYHDGFLGHSYVGEWVNFGAGTYNSDLRNDYGEVTVIVNGERVATGLTKVGCFLGDHTKTGLGTLLNTGTNVGAFCNLLPAGTYLSRYVPSFCSWWNGALSGNVNLPRLLQTAAEVMRRRGCAFTEAHAVLYSTLVELTTAQRQRALAEAQRKHLRRSA
jgi:UDP-N-acetylglucosamine diphosphorylase/glucosamine-1-phosphate N-acetyltransferase